MAHKGTRPHNWRDLTGQRFGQLVAQEYVGTRGKLALWRFACDCGVVKIAPSRDIFHGKTKTCGHQKGGAKTTHQAARRGLRTPEYLAWSRIKHRCGNPNNANYDRYGGRGITVAPEWQKDFAAFFAHIGKQPSPLHTIERIDNDAGYVPGNVRWATRKEQSQNKSNNVFVHHDGERITLAAYFERTGLKRCTYYARVKRGQGLGAALSLHHMNGSLT